MKCAESRGRSRLKLIHKAETSIPWSGKLFIRLKKKCKLLFYPRSTQEFIWTRLNVSVRSRSIWNLEVLVFEKGGKPEYPKKNLSEQRREPTTTSTRIWRRRRDLNPGHIGGGQGLSPLRHPRDYWTLSWKPSTISKPGRSDSKRFGVLDCADIRRANETIVREYHSILTGKQEICPEMALIGENGENSTMLGEYSYEVARVLFESGEYGEYGDHSPKYSRFSKEMEKNWAIWKWRKRWIRRKWRKFTKTVGKS